MQVLQTLLFSLAICVPTVVGCGCHDPDAVFLYQRDFVNGTYRITRPGQYVLGENISFIPNPPTDTQDPYDSFFPRPDQLGDGPGQYPKAEYHLGFFAAITVEAADVEIDLNRYTLEQSAEHALMQRFFALIELANSPFIVGQGPHDFTNHFVAASNTKIHNGRIGRSSHQGIHGNANANITIEYINFVDFEVAAIALNGVEGLRVEHCRMENRKDVPVFGTFASARFLQRYVDFLVDSNSSTTLTVMGAAIDAQGIQNSMRNCINRVYGDVRNTGGIDPVNNPVEYSVFSNFFGLTDGNGYCFLLNPIGVAVNGFPLTTAPGKSDDVYLNNLNCISVDICVREVVALQQNSQAVTDPVSSVIRLLNRHENGEYLTIGLPPSGDIDQAWYKGSPIADAQMFVGKAILNGDFDNQSELSVTRNGVTQAMIDWVEAGQLGLLGDLTAAEGWLCNGDSMFHVQKGVIAFKLDGITNLRARRLMVGEAINKGIEGSGVCGDYTYSHPLATHPFYNGAISRGVSLAGSHGAFLEKTIIKCVHAPYGDSIGVDVHTDSYNITLEKTKVRGVTSLRADAIGIRLGEDTTENLVNGYTLEEPSAPLGEVISILDDGSMNTINQAFVP